MIMQLFVSDLLGAIAYLIADEKAGEAVVVDAPHAITDELMAAAERLGLRIRYIINTHGHFDHVADNVALKMAADAEIAANVGDADRMAKPESVFFALPFEIPPSVIDHPLQEGDIITIGDITLRILHTPGHTPGSICVYDAQHGMLWTGDTLFAGTYGRTDLRGGDEAQMFASLARLAILPPETQVFPGHGEDTTIGGERWLQRTNLLAKFNR
jgi:hydroxyacylglutathione hydrolase